MAREGAAASTTSSTYKYISICGTIILKQDSTYLHGFGVNWHAVVLLGGNRGVVASSELNGRGASGTSIRTISKGRALDGSDDFAEVLL